MKLVNRFIHKGMSASLRPIKGTNNRWSVFGATDLPSVDIEPVAFGLKYLNFKVEEGVMPNYPQIAVLLKSVGLPAEVRNNGETESIVIEALDNERIIFAAGEGGWGYTLVNPEGLVEVGFFDELPSDAPPEDVAQFIIVKIDWLFE